MKEKRGKQKNTLEKVPDEVSDRLEVDQLRARRKVTFAE